MWKEVFELATPICPVPGEAKDSMLAVSHELVVAGWWLSPTPLKNMSSSVGIL